MATKGQTAASAKYNAKTYSRIGLWVKKEQKEIIRQHAESLGESLNGYISRLIAEDMAKTKK